MISGWSAPELGHNWNDGIEAMYVIATASPAGRLLLSVVGEPYVSRARPLQEMTIFGNGHRVVGKRMTARVETAINCALEPEWWVQRGSMVQMRLTFCLPHSVRPSDIADGPDGRELGFCFRSISLRTLPG